MSDLKAGLILKNRCVIAEGANDSHSDLLESLGIEDNIENAMRVFVRVELLPPNEGVVDRSRHLERKRGSGHSAKMVRERQG